MQPKKKINKKKLRGQKVRLVKIGNKKTNFSLFDGNIVCYLKTSKKIAKLLQRIIETQQAGWLEKQ